MAMRYVGSNMGGRYLLSRETLKRFSAGLKPPVENDFVEIKEAEMLALEPKYKLPKNRLTPDGVDWVAKQIEEYYDKGIKLYTSALKIEFNFKSDDLRDIVRMYYWLPEEEDTMAGVLFETGLSEYGKDGSKKNEIVFTIDPDYLMSVAD